jgi:hypothetical protein
MAEAAVKPGGLVKRESSNTRPMLASCCVTSETGKLAPSQLHEYTQWHHRPNYRTLFIRTVPTAQTRTLHDWLKAQRTTILAIERFELPRL